MIEVDLHVHSIFSLCGLHTAIELLDYAKSMGMKGIAITDHGLTLGGRLTSVFFERLNDPVPGIRLFKGVECNLLEKPGKIDCPRSWLQFMDIVLLGIHPNTPRRQGKEKNTAMLVEAMQQNPYIDVITHPNSLEYPVDFVTLAKAAKECDMALEINNSKDMLQRIPPEMTKEFLTVCKEVGCSVVLNSDTHALTELGRDEDCLPLLEEVAFPKELIQNRDATSAFDYLSKRKKRREKFL